MPEITWFGWVHTIIAIFGLLAGFYSLAKYKFILWEQLSGKMYLVFTFIAAVTSLMIYNQGGFGPAHFLGVLTLMALFCGSFITKIPVFSKIADYFQTLCFSGTLLFHMIPAITDGLRRLPPGNPIVAEADDPLLLKFYLLFVVIFLIGYAVQFILIRNRE